MLVNYGEANVQQILTSNAYNSSDYLNLTVGQPTEESNFEFMMMFSFSVLPFPMPLIEFDRFGTFVVTNEELTWNPFKSQFNVNETNLTFHKCTADDIIKLGKAAEKIVSPKNS